MATTLKVGGSFYTGILGMSCKQSIANYAWSFNALISDKTRSKRDTINQTDEVEVVIDDEFLFLGTVEVKEPTDTKLLKLGGRDHSARFNDIQISAQYTAVSSTMITSMLSTFYPGEFTTTGVETTTVTKTKNFNANWARHAFNDLAGSEGFVWFVDTDKDFKFRPETFTDNGKSFADKQILGHNFKEVSKKIVNSVSVVFGADLDKSVRRVDQDSIDIYRERQKREPRRDITTIAEAIDYGDFLLRKWKAAYVEYDLLFKLDATLRAGEIIRVTHETPGYTNQEFLILEVGHSAAPRRSKVKVGIVTPGTAEVLQEVIRKMRNVEEQGVAASIAVTRVDDVNETLGVSMLVTIDRRNTSGAIAGTFLAAEKTAGSRTSGSWVSIPGNEDQPAIVVNNGIESILRLVTQIATVPTNLSNTNADIAIGSDDTPATVLDTTLALQTLRRASEAGFPTNTNYGISEWQSIITDADIGITTIRELGLFNDPAAGKMFARYITLNSLGDPAAIVKAVDEEIRITIKMTITGVKVTNAGLNLFRDILIGASTDFLDSAAGNAAIEVSGSGTYRELVNSPTPEFSTTLLNKIRYQITVSNPGEYSTGGTITLIELYNMTTGGVQVITIVTPTITTVATEENLFRMFLELLRS